MSTLALLLSAAVLSCAPRPMPATAPEPTETTSPSVDAVPTEPATPIADPSARATATAQALAQIPMVGGYLIEAESGRAIRLWEQWGYAGGTWVSFSADGRLLAYNRPYPVTAEGEIYLLDLTTPNAPPAFVAKGIAPKLSPPETMLAFLTSHGTGEARTSRINVRAADGTVHTLDPPGRNHRWSPDGNWLTYITSHHDLAPVPKPPGWRFPDDRDSAVILVNTRDWSSRAVGLVYSCHCGSQYGAFWTLDSRWFTYRYASELTEFLVSPETLERVPTSKDKWKELDYPEDAVVGLSSWDKRMAASVRPLPCPECKGPEDRRSYELFLIDAETGHERRILGPVPATSRARPGVVWSPDSRYLLFCDFCRPEMTLDRGN